MYAHSQESQTRVRLRRQWWLAALGACALACGSYILLRSTPGGAFSPDQAARWTLLAAGLMAVELAVLGRNLHKNRARGSAPLRPSLGWGNWVTLLRGAAYGCMAGFLLASRPPGLLAWAPALLYIGAVAADYLDGYLARVTGHTSELGEILDIEFDGLGILIAMALTVQYGQLPAIVLLLALSRPLFLWGMKLRERWGLPNHPMTPSDERRIVAGLLMGFMGIVLWPVFAPPATHIAGAIFGGAVALSFARDWLVVIGWLRPASPAYMLWRTRLKSLLFVWLPLLLRVGALPLLVWFVRAVLQSPGGWSNSPLLFAAALLVGVTALLGVIARLSALGMISLACADLILRGDSPETFLLLAAGGLLMVLGNGALALWTPDERLLRRRAGSAAD